MNKKKLVSVLCIIAIVLLSICAIISIITAIQEGIDFSNGINIVRDIFMVGIFVILLRRINPEKK